MGYLKEFLSQINNRDVHKFILLWEEYCLCDSLDTEEFSQLLMAIKKSDMAKPFGQIVESALPMWKTVQDENESYTMLKLLIDLETTNNPALYEIALDTLKKHYGNDPKFHERLRLIGLRGSENLQGALSRYDLISHMAKGNVVFHTGGWGTGQIMEVSFVREHLVIEFENVSGKKDISFANAYKTLIPLPNAHFLARRFSDPDKLEAEGRQDPAALIKLLLHDLGPKAASEIKDELCDLVIPEAGWSKWWQAARAKAKKDPMIESPETLKEPFYLRKAEISAEQRLQHSIKDKTNASEIVLTTYNFVRDEPSVLKNPDTKRSLQTRLLDALESSDISEAQSLQILILLEQYFGFQAPNNRLAKIIQQSSNIERTIQNIEILAFKKRALIAIKEFRNDWNQLFLSGLFNLPQVQLRDFILKELNQDKTRAQLEAKLSELLKNPVLAPETFVWYFQKLVNKDEDKIPFQNEQGRATFFEAFFILYNIIEGQNEYRDLVKKMYNMLSGKRYALVRELLQGTSIEFTKEILLLATKCLSLSDSDQKILRSLAEVVHPSLTTAKGRRALTKEEEEDSEIWTTEAGYQKIQDRIQQIGTIEMIENAREIEAARALGDLRENSEFKFAQERRNRLQIEMKSLSDQLKRARVITPVDVDPSEVSVGSIVDIETSSGESIRYVILGPWDANPDDNILSFNSKLALSMIGKKTGESFNFKEEQFKIAALASYFNQ